MFDQPELFPEPVSAVLVHAWLKPGEGWTVVVRSCHGLGRPTKDAGYERLVRDEALAVVWEELARLTL